MFVRSRDYDNAIAKVKICLGTLLGLDNDDEAYIVLKELPTRYMLALSKAGQTSEEDANQVFWDALPNIIVKHNFYEDENTLMTPEAIRDLLMEKLDVYSKVMQEYTRASFFTQKTENAES